MIAAIAPLAIALISSLLRIRDLARPKGFVFDEVYYVDGARDYLAHGVEVTGAKPEFIVHPPVGKWLIAAGIKIFGDNEFGWRIASAVFGTLLILLLALLAHRAFRSPLLTGCAAGLMALDGLALVHSRTALLDLFLTFFVLAATYFWFDRRYIATGLALGLAVATKWSALYFLAIFMVIALYRIFTYEELKAMPKKIAGKVGALVILPIAVYITSWWGWFASDRGWDRRWSSNVIASFWHYHSEMLNFHTSLTQKHSYEANPWTWSLMMRPTSFFYATPQGCEADRCSQEVLALGTPVLWWAGTIAMIVVLGFWLVSIYKRKHDPVLHLITLGIAAGYLPWFFFQERTVFSFYAIVFEPFMILAILYCIQRLLALPGKQPRIAIAFFFFLVAANFLYFLPLFNATPIPYDDWYARMWLPSWI